MGKGKKAIDKYEDKQLKTYDKKVMTPEMQNKLQPGSYKMIDGKLVPNLEDPAMAAREKKK